MNYTIERLLAGDPNIVGWYVAAKQHWQEILAKINAEDEDAIADTAFEEQMWFEDNCGTRWVGQEIMVVAGITQYYTTDAGFDKNFVKAKAMYEGLRKSDCSVGIHSHAEILAESIFPELLEAFKKPKALKPKAPKHKR